MEISENGAKTSPRPAGAKGLGGNSPVENQRRRTVRCSAYSPVQGMEVKDYRTRSDEISSLKLPRVRALVV
jgi:hypothetical protein